MQARWGRFVLRTPRFALGAGRRAHEGGCDDPSPQACDVTIIRRPAVRVRAARAAQSAGLALVCAALVSACGGGGGGGGEGTGGGGGAGSDGLAGPLELPPATLVGDPFLGANLPGVADWSRSQVYVDLVRQARKFGSPAAPWDGSAPLGSDGWPTGDFGVVLFTEQNGVANVLGAYQGAFTGRATVTSAVSDGTVRNVRYDEATNTTRFEVVVAAPGDQLMLAFTGTGGGIRDLRVVRPGYSLDNTPLFTSAFLDHVRRFHVFRFMDWTATNGSPAIRWAERPTPATVHHLSDQGVPWEHVVALANQRRRDVWINVPFKADDNYVSQLARLLKSTLDPELKVYVEFSNELWNLDFPQAQDNLALARAEVAADARSVLAYDGSTDPYSWAMRRVARRLKEISDLFRAVYGDAAMMTTVRPVLAGQSANPYFVQTGLDMVNAIYGEPSRYFHGTAGAPYFNLGSLQTTEGLVSSQVLERLQATAATVPVEHQYEANLGVARWYGLRFHAYEGGPDTFGPGSLDAKAAAHQDGAMGTLCQSFLRDWYRQGGDLFLWYSAGASDFRSRFGAWALTPDLAQTSAPKLECMNAVGAAGRPGASLRHAVPFTAVGMATASSYPPYADPALRNLSPGQAADYVVQASSAGTYQLVLTTAAAQPGNTLDIGVNNRWVVSGLALPATGGATGVDSPALSITLPQGVSTIRLRAREQTGEYAVLSLSVR